MKGMHWAVLSLAALTAACADDPTTPPVEAGEVAEARAERSLKPAETPTVVDVALSVNASTGEFSTLIAAVLAAGLADDLSARGQRTVFAPTDAAFADLGLDETNIGDLPVEALTNILLYHVAPGRRYAEDVVDSDQIRMLNGGFNPIEVVGSDVFIGDEPAQIVQTDIEASNGVIHVIDAVLLP
jgi:uncharacterized surface protein with fasciclin (FAS1) repeats